MSFDPIAVIGHGCVLPGINNPEELWETALNRKIQISSADDKKWRINTKRILKDKGDFNPDGTYSDKGGYVRRSRQELARKLEKVITRSSRAEDLASLDPVFLWTMEASRQALSGAGYLEKENLPGGGIILGNLSYPSVGLSAIYETTILKQFNLPLRREADEVNWLNRFMSGGPAMLTALAFNLSGAAYSIDAACASALHALKLACDELQSGRAEFMLAGGVCAADPLFINMGFAALTVLSSDGRCRPFSTKADGLVPAEGAAMLLLKKLSRAIDDKDQILGVIRGIGLSNDGRSSGLLSPSQSDQERCILKAFQSAQASPEEISFIECHATGAPTGDRVEIKSLKKFFHHQAAIGSLKANIGHCLTASGAAGLVKVLKAFEHNIIPPFPETNEWLPELQTSSFIAPERPLEWRQTGKAACVNTFGFGGNNAQVILEDWDSFRTRRKHAKKDRRAENTKKYKVAIVAAEIITEKVDSLPSFFKQFIQTDCFGSKSNPLESVKLDIKKTALPPADLKKTLGQQLILLKLTERALKNVSVDPENTGVFIGFGVDPEISRIGLRWRLPDLVKGARDNDWLQKTKRAIAPPLAAADVLGKMPNMATGE